ncbi:TKT Transketolase, partial [Atractosteus spatula]|nr:TKT Transketolase [Atractosteus spatula]
MASYHKPDEKTLQGLKDTANKLRIHSIKATCASNSGHPTSCCSAAEIMSVLFFHTMKYKPLDPRNPNNDRFILSKVGCGHVCMHGEVGGTGSSAGGVDPDPHPSQNDSSSLADLCPSPPVQGHAAPILYAAWAEAGYVKEADLLVESWGAMGFGDGFAAVVPHLLMGPPQTGHGEEPGRTGGTLPSHSCPLADWIAGGTGAGVKIQTSLVLRLLQ